MISDSADTDVVVYLLGASGKEELALSGEEKEGEGPDVKLVVTRAICNHNSIK